MNGVHSTNGRQQPALSFGEFQEASLRTWKLDDPPRERLMHAALGLSGEAGEVAELVKKDLFFGRRTTRAELADELGDVLFYLAMLAWECGISLEDVARGNVDKLRERHPDGFSTARYVTNGGGGGR